MPVLARQTCYSALRERYRLGERPTVVCVSRLVPRKGQDTLIAAWLVLGSQSEANDPAPAGQVISQDPAAGTSVPSGSAVNVVLSKGPATVAVPSATAPTSSSFLNRSSSVCTGEVCHTTETVAVDTMRLFSPIRMIAVPTTTSVPFSDAEPMRIA